MVRAGNVSKSKVPEPQVAPQSSSKLSNRLGPPKEISFSDLVPVKRSSSAELSDNTTPHREGAAFEESSSSRRVRLGTTAPTHSNDTSLRGDGDRDEPRQKSYLSQSAFERLDKTSASDSGYRPVKTKVCIIDLMINYVIDWLGKK